MRPLRACPTILAFLAFTSPLWGQAGKAELFGTIQDPGKLPVANVNVSCVDLATSARTAVTTDNRGEYHLLGLSPGKYELSAEKSGFRPLRQTGFTLRSGDQTRLDMTLELGESAQAVNVNAAPSLLETASGAVSFHVSQREIQTLPLDGRNFIPLVVLSPGVALPGGGSLLPRIDGSRPRTKRISLRRY